MFGILTYYLALSGYSSSARLQFFPQQPAEVNVANPSDNTDPKALLETIKRRMLSDNLHRDPTLSLSQLAAKLKSNTSLVSKAINTGSGQNFNDFINAYRVKEIKRAIEKGELKHKTLEGLALDAGFNSKSTFLRSFKKVTGMTPTAYKNSV